MRPFPLRFAPFLGLAALAVPAAAGAHDLSVTLASRYVDTSTFNDVFSSSPMLQAEGTLDLGKGAYASAYAYTGFRKPFRDQSSEYGVEVGKEVQISSKATLTLAAGRYADYEGRGFHAGDWYGKAEVAYGNLTASASVLRGETDSVLLRASYDVSVTEKFSLRPSVAVFTSDGRINPGLDVSYRISDRFSIGGRFVLPKNSDGHGRRPYAAIALTHNF